MRATDASAAFRRRLVVGAVGAAAAAAGVWVAHRSEPAPPDPAAAALLALELPDHEGRPLALSQWRGQVLVINFWGTWCPPCITEMPELSRLATELEPAGVRFVGIAIDHAAAVAKFAREKPVAYPLVVAGMGATQNLKLLGHNDGSLPFTVVLGRNGRIIERTAGIVDPARLRAVATGRDALATG